MSGLFAPGRAGTAVFSIARIGIIRNGGFGGNGNRFSDEGLADNGRVRQNSFIVTIDINAKADDDSFVEADITCP